MGNLKNLIFFLLLVMTSVVKSQSKKAYVAYEFFEKNELDSAKYYIDKALLDSNAISDATTWQVRGYIYMRIYNKKEKANKHSGARIEALTSLKKSIFLDVKRSYYEDNNQAMKYLINTLHHDAGQSLELNDYKLAIELFELQIEYTKVLNVPLKSIQTQEIEFLLALASVYQSLMLKFVDSIQVDNYHDLAKKSYSRVLSIEPDNKSANYNMGILNYNKAVGEIKAIEKINDTAHFENNLTKGNLNQDSLTKNKLQKIDSSRYKKAEGLFKEALPFFENASTTSMFFSLNKTSLNYDSYKMLDSIVNLLKIDTTYICLVEGYTDSTGSYNYNLKLSKKRAKVVMQYLIQSGIKSSRIIINGYGESEPIYPNTTLEGRAKNRRVSIKIKKQKSNNTRK